MNMHQHNRRNGWFQSRLTTWILLGFLVVIAFFLITEHTAHFFGLLPFALFLLCPLMMFFMMRDGHGGPPSDSQNQQQPPEGGQQ